MQLFACPVADSVTCKLGGGNASSASCPRYCSSRLGSPAACFFSAAEVYDHCPWDSKRNFNTFFDAAATLFYVTTGDSSWTDTMHRGMRSQVRVYVYVCVCVYDDGR